MNPIENALAMLKAMLCEAAGRTLDGLSAAIGRIADAFAPAEFANCFSACGYDPDWQDSTPTPGVEAPPERIDSREFTRHGTIMSEEHGH